MHKLLRPILTILLLLTTIVLSASVYPPISSGKCLQEVMFHYAEHTAGDPCYLQAGTAEITRLGDATLTRPGVPRLRER